MAEITVQDLFNAMPRRHSVRHYTGGDIAMELLNQLMAPRGIRGLGVAPCRVELVYAPGQIDGVFSGIIGSYGKIRGASAILTLVVPEDSGEQGLMEAGYVGEQYVLRATHLGLATCWVGGMFRFKTLMGRTAIGPRDKIAAIISVGQAVPGPDRFGKAIHSLIKRKTTLQIAEPQLLAQSDWVRDAIEAVRIAPSAVHRQPWFLSGHPHRVVLSATKQGGFTYMDLGIAMIHFELAAEQAGHPGKWHVGDDLYFS